MQAIFKVVYWKILVVKILADQNYPLQTTHACIKFSQIFQNLRYELEVPYTYMKYFSTSAYFAY